MTSPDPCPHCRTDLARAEIPAWHRWPEGHWLRKAAEKYVRGEGRDGYEFFDAA